MPKSLHGKLAQLAEAEGVSLNAFVVTLLSEAVGLIAGVSRIERVVTSTLTRWNATFVRTITTITQARQTHSGTLTMQFSNKDVQVIPETHSATSHAKYMHMQ
jgi:HicB family